MSKKYPIIEGTTNTSELGEKHVLTQQVKVEMLKNEMAAYITIIPPENGELITQEEIILILKNHHIIYGIDRAAIEKMIQNKYFNKKQAIAFGKPPQNGHDGEIKYLFCTDMKIRPEVLKDGRVDFKQLNIVQNVKKGACLAEKTLPTQGMNGITVTGKAIRSKPGKSVYFKKGKNVRESEDHMKLFADTDGQPKLIENKVMVSEVYEVENVDNSTGNIKFNGKVMVRGCVRTGFAIECDGDVEVYGTVEGATIIAGGSIILHKGIQGQNMGKLLSKGDVVSKYMENCYAKAYGNIYADTIMHCNLESKTTIVAEGKKGLIVGGHARARNEITAKTIGSSMATATKIEVGIDPDVVDQYERLKKELELLDQNKENVEKVIKLLYSLSKAHELPTEKQQMLQKSLSTKKYLKEQIEKKNKDLIYLQYKLQLLSKGRVNVSSIIYFGVKICIGSSAYYVRDKIEHCTFVKDNNEIKMIGYLGHT
jgi:uncharacterized protein (DUF342 family)